MLFSVETDKATLDAESTDEGILAKIIKRNGSVNAINDLVGLMVEEGEDWKNVKGMLQTTFLSLNSFISFSPNHHDNYCSTSYQINPGFC